MRKCFYGGQSGTKVKSWNKIESLLIYGQMFVQIFVPTLITYNDINRCLVLSQRYKYILRNASTVWPDEDSEGASQISLIKPYFEITQ